IGPFYRHFLTVHTDDDCPKTPTSKWGLWGASVHFSSLCRCADGRWTRWGRKSTTGGGMTDIRQTEAASAHKAAVARRDKSRRAVVRLGAVVATLRRNCAGALQIEAARQEVRDAENRLRRLDVELAMAERKFAAAVQSKKYNNNNGLGEG